MPLSHSIHQHTMSIAKEVENAHIPEQRPLAIFSDFDGTIFLQDTGHVLFDNFGCGPERREILDESIFTGERTFKGASEELWGSLNVTLDEGFKTLEKELTMDPGFTEFLKYVQRHHIPFSVISAGIRPLLRVALDESIGKDKSSEINIVSNDAIITADGSKWTPLWRHPDSDLGHDKSVSLQEFKDATEEVNPIVIFIGDGVSDLPAAKHSDVLFARRGLKLEQYCQANKIPYIPYDDFNEIRRDLRKYVKGNRHHDLRYGASEDAELVRSAASSMETSPSASPGLKPLTNLKMTNVEDLNKLDGIPKLDN